MGDACHPVLRPIGRNLKGALGHKAPTSDAPNSWQSLQEVISEACFFGRLWWKCLIAVAGDHGRVATCDLRYV